MMSEDKFKDFVPEVSYKVTVEKSVTYIKRNDTNYQNTHKKDKNGEDIWEHMPVPDSVQTKKNTIFQQCSEKTDVLALIAAVNGVTFHD